METLAAEGIEIRNDYLLYDLIGFARGYCRPDQNEVYVMTLESTEQRRFQFTLEALTFMNGVYSLDWGLEQITPEKRVSSEVIKEAISFSGYNGGEFSLELCSLGASGFTFSSKRPAFFFYQASSVRHEPPSATMGVAADKVLNTLIPGVPLKQKRIHKPVSLSLDAIVSAFMAASEMPNSAILAFQTLKCKIVITSTPNYGPPCLGDNRPTL